MYSVARRETLDEEMKHIDFTSTAYCIHGVAIEAPFSKPIGTFLQKEPFTSSDDTNLNIDYSGWKGIMCDRAGLACLRMGLTGV